MKNRVVITGMGIYSCIGTSLQEVQASLYEGRSGIIYDAERKKYGYRSALTGAVPAPQLKELLGRRERISMGEESEYAYMATLEAMATARIDADYLKTHEVGILYGNDSVAESVILTNDRIREKQDTTLVGSGAVFRTMNSTVTMNLSTLFALRGVNMTISAACASGSHAVGLGYLLLQSGMQEMILCGGAQETNKYSMGSFDGLGVFSMREDTPEQASRPFDASRDGLVPSGGAATLVLETYESAAPWSTHPCRSSRLWLLLQWRTHIHPQCGRPCSSDGTRTGQCLHASLPDRLYQCTCHLHLHRGCQ